MTRLALAAFAALMLLAVGRTTARAEGTTQSMSVWHIAGSRAQVTAWVPIALARRFGASGEAGSPDALESIARASLITGDYLARHLVLVTAMGPCAPVGGGPAAGRVEEPWIVHEWSVSCPSDHGFRLRDDAFFDDAPTHAHFARIELLGADAAAGDVVEKVLTAADRVLETRHVGHSSHGGRRSVGATALAALEQIRCGLPMWLALSAAVLASAVVLPAAWPVALATAVGLALGVLAPAGAVTVSVPIAAAAILALALAALVREGANGSLAAAIYVGATLASVVRAARPHGDLVAQACVLIGLALLAITSGRSAVANVALVAAAALIVSATAVAATSPSFAISDRVTSAGVFAAIALASVALVGRLGHSNRRRMARPLAAAVIAVSIAWLAIR